MKIKVEGKWRDVCNLQCRAIFGPVALQKYIVGITTVEPTMTEAMYVGIAEIEEPFKHLPAELITWLGTATFYSNGQQCYVGKETYGGALHD